MPAEPARKDWLYPAGQAWKYRQKVTSESGAKVDAIRHEAMAKGLSESRLYQNQGRQRPGAENRCGRRATEKMQDRQQCQLIP